MRIQSSLLPNRFMSPWVIGFIFISDTWMDSARKPEARCGTCNGLGSHCSMTCYRVKKGAYRHLCEVHHVLAGPTCQGEVSRQAASGLSTARLLCAPNQMKSSRVIMPECYLRLPCEQLHVIRTQLSPFSQYCFQCFFSIRHSL